VPDCLSLVGAGLRLSSWPTCPAGVRYIILDGGAPGKMVIVDVIYDL